MVIYRWSYYRCQLTLFNHKVAVLHKCYSSLLSIGWDLFILNTFWFLALTFRYFWSTFIVSIDFNEEMLRSVVAPIFISPFQLSSSNFLFVFFTSVKFSPFINKLYFKTNYTPNPTRAVSPPKLYFEYVWKEKNTSVFPKLGSFIYSSSQSHATFS